MTDVTVDVPGADVRSRPTAAGGPPALAERPDFDVVPRLGLVIVAIIFVGLILAILANRLWPLVFLHVGFGAAWTIIDLFMGFIIGPIMGRLPVPARIQVATRLMPKMLLIMPTVVTVTLAAGWQLGTVMGTVNSSYYNHSWIVASYIVVGFMAVVALGLLSPANVAVLMELKKPKPNPVVIQTLMKRFIFAAGFTGTMQLAILVIMTKIRVG
ncbi:MAG TPA: hypothetical protein VIC03_13135 [Gemmatimonadaceae bacterium]|jgi:hypothetical protein